MTYPTLQVQVGLDRQAEFHRQAEQDRKARQFKASRRPNRLRLFHR